MHIKWKIVALAAAVLATSSSGLVASRAATPTHPVATAPASGTVAQPTVYSAYPGGPPVPAPTGSVESAKPISVSMTPADCQQIVSLAREKRLKSPPSTCTSGSVKTAGRELTASYLPECNPSSGPPTGGWIALNRRQACNSQDISIVTLEVPSGKIIGTTTIYAGGKLLASTTRAEWTHSVDVIVRGWTGVGFPEESTGRYLACPTDCVNLGALYGRRGTTFDSWNGSATLGSQTLALNQTRQVFGIWYAKFNGAGWGNSVEVGIPGALSRCDNATAQRPAGCVFSNIPAVNSYSKTTVPDYVKHVNAAQLSGLPGRIGSGTVLHRLTSTTQQDANRAKACPASLPRPSGYSCDEYPMAATYEGASTGGGTLARSFDFCRTMDPPRTGPTGWSRCMIPATQNSSASGTYNQFVRDARMLDADPFQIAFIP